MLDAKCKFNAEWIKATDPPTLYAIEIWKRCCHSGNAWNALSPHLTIEISILLTASCILISSRRFLSVKASRPHPSVSSDCVFMSWEWPFIIIFRKHICEPSCHKKIVREQFEDRHRNLQKILAPVAVFVSWYESWRGTVEDDPLVQRRMLVWKLI